MQIAALAGGVGAGKFLRGLVQAAPQGSVSAIVNTGDDITMHGLHVSPDLDSVTYWLADAMDRDRGWGRRDDTFRATEELRRLDAEAAWFSLGDLDLATHLLRTRLLDQGRSLSEATARIAEGFGLAVRVLPMSDDPVTTRIDAVSAGRDLDLQFQDLHFQDLHFLDLHFQEYWVGRGGRDEVKGVRYEGAAEARPAPGVLEAIDGSDLVVICPSNPVASIGPILAVPGIRTAVEARERVVGISPIVGGAPLAGMADRLMPVAGFEVSALGAARAYERLLSGWVIDERDRASAGRIELELGIEVAVTDTIMADDERGRALAAVALELAGGP